MNNDNRAFLAMTDPVSAALSDQAPFLLEDVLQARPRILSWCLLHFFARSACGVMVCLRLFDPVAAALADIRFEKDVLQAPKVRALGNVTDS
jgi:hypothetical protein